MNRSEIEGALDELASELDRRGVTARIYLVGGAAMVLAYLSRFSTEDVDANVHPTEDVLAVAEEIADRRGLGHGWLDNAVQVYIPSAREPDWRPVSRVGSVEIAVADQRIMLAMKLRASRGRRDELDIEYLLRICGIASEHEALTLYEEYFPDDELPVRARPMLQHALAKLTDE
jgi:hypothetical protein